MSRMRSNFGMGFETTARAKWTPRRRFSIRISAQALPFPFLFSLPLFLFPFLFFYSEKRSCGWEMRELAFRDTYWYLFSRRRKYSAFFPSPPPLILFGFVRYAWFAIRFSQKFCMERCCKIKSYISVCSCKKDSNWFDLKFRILTSLILAFFFMRKRKNILMFYYKTIFIVHYNTILITVICS